MSSSVFAGNNKFIGDDNRNNNDSESSSDRKLLLPILIIPGFMSSGLDIEESEINRGWKGKRVWLNLHSIGISAMYFGNAQKKNKKSSSSSNNDSQGVTIYDDDDEDDEGDEERKEQKQQLNYKSSWLRHMMLDMNSMKFDPPGIKVRPIQGLEGVDYLTPGPITSHISYVFGPVIKALEKKGYNSSDGPINLMASTYDWRLSPNDMEDRDEYFTKTKNMIEELYKANNSTPVVILAHSLGCKVSHYFLNFVLDHYGQKWIDVYIHTFMPVGGPHLGAPKACRAIISGDKMGLDTFLNDEEAITMGRSWGSSPWLVPAVLPDGVPGSNYILPHGVLELTFPNAIDTDSLVSNRTFMSRPKRYQLLVIANGLDDDNGGSKASSSSDRGIRTPFYKISSDLGENVVVFSDAELTFVTPMKPHLHETLQFILLEPGLASAKKEKEKCECRCWVWCVCFLCIPCMIAYKFVEFVLRSLARATNVTADAIARSTGGSSTLAFSEAIKIPKSVWNQKSTIIKVPVYHTDDYGSYDVGCFFRKKRRYWRQVELVVKLQWKKFNKEKSFKQICSPICRPSWNATHLPIASKSNKENQNNQYEEFSGYDVMEREGLQRTLQFFKSTYDGDKYLPRSHSSVDPPPVKRIHAIYGINLPTEIGCVYERQDTCQSKNRLQSFYVPDKKATIISDGKKFSGNNKAGYKICSGLICETSKTKQKVWNDRQVSGDGTVPYWSLAHSKTWHNTKEGRIVTVQELDKAPHREILADPRFHDAVLSYTVRSKNKNSCVK